MRVLIIFLVAATLLACSEQEPTTVEGRALHVLQESAADFPALNATVMINGEIVWEATAGKKIADGDNPGADYNVYSTAKMMTGMAYAKLEESQIISVDAAIRVIDPELPEHLHAITLRQLLNHTAGIRNYSSDEDWDSFANRRCVVPADALPQFIGDPLIAAPGEKYQYTTYGFVLLSHLLVKITGAADFDAAMNSVLGDVYAATTDSDDAVKATNYGDWLFGLGFKELDDINAQCKFGAGGLVTSARDLAQMGAALAEGDVIGKETIATLLQPGKTNGGDDVAYAFGMGVGTSENFEPPTRYAAHSGGSPGGRSYLLVLFEPGIVVGMSTNFDGPNLGKTAAEIAKVFAAEGA